MCISLISTAHPQYSLILLSNRDEFFHRPTARARWWDAPNEHILGGRDLQRPEKGTWLAITKDGRIAVLTNFREEGGEIARDKSRGGIVNAYLTPPPRAVELEEVFVDRLLKEGGIHDVGGFTLVFGRLCAPHGGKYPGLTIISNRTASAQRLQRITTAVGETYGLSNSHFGDSSWLKVSCGERLLRDAIAENVELDESEHAFLAKLFNILSVDNLPTRQDGEPWDVFVRQMRHSILIPPVGGDAIESSLQDHAASAQSDSSAPHRVQSMGGPYGTQKQTVVLVGTTGKVRFVERTLYDGAGQPVSPNEQHQSFTFDIDQWG